jgi:hypothetical protein
MVLRAVATLLLMSILIGASNSSNSVFVFEFSSNPTSESLVSAAIAALEQSEFHAVANNHRTELQYRNQPIWAYVSSPAPGQLHVSLAQLRGGCGHNPEVTGANETIARIRANLESQFGHASIAERHVANQREQ